MALKPKKKSLSQVRFHISSEGYNVYLDNLFTYLLISCGITKFQKFYVDIVLTHEPVHNIPLINHVWRQRALIRLLICIVWSKSMLIIVHPLSFVLSAVNRL